MSKFKISTKSAKLNELQVRKIKKELVVHRNCALSKIEISAFLNPNTFICMPINYHHGKMTHFRL